MSRALREPADGDVLAVCIGWSVFAPVGLKYPLLLGATLWGLWQLRQQNAFGRVWSEPAARWALAFWAWSALTALWSAGPWQDALAQIGLYSLLLSVSLIGVILPGYWARRTLQNFSIAAGVVGSMCLLKSWEYLPAPDAWLWKSTVTAEGNQRIVTSLLLAVGCTLALREAWLSWQSGTVRWATLGWCAVACAAALGLASQDRRTGMVTLPVLLLLLSAGMMRARHTSRTKIWTTALAAVACCVALGAASPDVRDRFAEGLGELARYDTTGEVATSWGMRLRMVEQSVQMASESRIAGHGLGSWVTLWTQRVPKDSLLAQQRTPHSEFLLVAVQTGLIGTILFLATLWTQATRGLRMNQGSMVPASLLVWGALAWAGLFNVVLRDAKFALPLLMLAALAWSVAGSEGRDDERGAAAPSGSR